MMTTDHLKTVAETDSETPQTTNIVQRNISVIKVLITAYKINVATYSDMAVTEHDKILAVVSMSHTALLVPSAPGLFISILSK
jgi:predicted transcriptional regulator